MAFSYRTFPRAHWSQINTTYLFHRVVKPLRERLRLAGPIDETAALTWLASVHLHRLARTVWGRRPYLRGK